MYTKKLGKTNIFLIVSFAGFGAEKNPDPRSEKNIPDPQHLFSTVVHCGFAT
jgi:hypothetical protein